MAATTPERLASATPERSMPPLPEIIDSATPMASRPSSGSWPPIDWKL
ncbi:Uncharacterised protein [Mycobacterium tuberculosis]|nr:Uncharacterised protein [Mycobacterium tuberculosis]